MAVSDSNASETEKSSKEAQKPKEKKDRPLTKVVVRRLPPGMNQESFLVQVSPIPDYDYMYIVKGDMSLGENAFARAYINFVNATDIFMFKEKFDNYVFVDQKGHEYPAVVEFASFQKIPRKRKPRPDPKGGTIESDPFYLEFLESLKEQPIQDVKPEFSYQLEAKDEVASTPLLDYIKQRRIDKQRIREERREERRRKELERKKLREDERKKHEQKSSGKTIVKPAISSRSSKASLDSVKEEATDKADSKVKSDDEKEESLSEKNASPSSATKDQKYEDRKQYLKSKQRYPPRPEKSEYLDKKSEYKNRREDYREKEYRSRRYDDYKREPDTKQTPRRTKKYSEKREERKNEARKAEQKKIDEALEKSGAATDVTSNVDEGSVSNNSDKANEKPEAQTKTCDSNNTNDKPKTKKHSTDDEEHYLERQPSVEDESATDSKTSKESKYRGRDDDPRVQRRIRNKDRPTMELYQPGRLSKRKPVEGPDSSNKE